MPGTTTKSEIAAGHTGHEKGRTETREERKAITVVRSMPGGAQSKLVRVGNGRFYVVKFTNNPQHRRTLLNEVIATTLLRALDLPAAEFSLIRFDDELLRSQPITLNFGSHHVRVRAGLHYGSLHPSDPSQDPSVVCDSLPSTILRAVGAGALFTGAYVADQWMSNTDARQAIFHRSGAEPWRIQLIDHGHAFSGPAWRFANSYRCGVYADPVVYTSARSSDEIHAWIDRIRAMPDHAFELAYRRIPEDWIEDDRPALINLVSKLHERRRRLHRILDDIMSHPQSPFSSR